MRDDHEGHAALVVERAEETLERGYAAGGSADAHDEGLKCSHRTTFSDKGPEPAPSGRIENPATPGVAMAKPVGAPVEVMARGRAHVATLAQR